MYYTPIGCGKWVIKIFFAGQLITGVYARESTLTGHLIVIVLFGVGAPYFIWRLLQGLFEARDARLDGDILSVSYVHLGERQYRLDSKRIRTSKITQLRLGPAKPEPMQLVRFGGWRMAVLPTDWKMPEQLSTGRTT